MARRLAAARQAFLDVVDFVVANAKSDPNAVFAGSVPYLLLAGNLVAGWQLGRALLAAEEAARPATTSTFMRSKIARRALLRRARADPRAGPARQHRRRLGSGWDMAVEAF